MTGSALFRYRFPLNPLQQTSPDAPFAAAIIGVSGFGRIHFEDLVREVDAGHLRAVGATIIPSDRERAAEQSAWLEAAGARIFPDHRSMLDSLAGRIDLCMIPTGIHLHAPMTIEALAAGANVFVEKPLAATVQEIEAVREAARAAGRFVAVGFQYLYDPVTLQLKQRLLDGAIGKVRSISAWGMWPRPASYYERNSWAGRLRTADAWVLDSPFNNAFAHTAVMMCFLAGPERRAAARLEDAVAELYRAYSIESVDTACIRARTCDGCMLHLYVTHLSETRAGPEVLVEGDKGCALKTCEHAVIRRHDAEEEILMCPQDEQLRSCVSEALLARLRGEDVFICDPEIAVVQTLLTDAAHESSEIHDINSEFITQHAHEDSFRLVVEGIDEKIRDCCAAKKLFSEAGTPWAHPGRSFDLKGYRGFYGGRTSI